ncbi:MAG TPA: FCD domain-containing protein [Acidimicrobiales bacterium]|nr:FCD domain-containing protein [Acidimicrobiales bacterium]
MSANAPSLVAGATGLLEPLTNRRTGERIAERLATAIALGQYWLGQRLPPERDLADLLSVSRSTVRDALALLSEQGLVEIRRGRAGGAYVIATEVPGIDSVIRRTLLPGWERFTQLLDFRSGVEQQIARLAAERRTEREAEEIRRLAAEYLSSGATREQSAEADRALHEAIARAAHNALWSELSVQLRFEVSQGLGVEPWSAELRQRGEEQHPALAEAVADGDPDRAGTLAAEHFAITSAAITALVASAAAAGDAAVPPPPDGARAAEGDRTADPTGEPDPSGDPAMEGEAHHLSAQGEKEARCRQRR